MKAKKFLLPGIFLAVMLVISAVVTVTLCYTTKPEIAKADFPFSITYEYKGEQAVLSGVYHCEFSGSYTIMCDHERWWHGEASYDTTGGFEYPFVVDSSDEMSLALYENMIPGYFMGDPFYMDGYYDGEVAPYVEYYDYVNDISLDEDNRDEVLESIGFKIIDYTYAEPIENSFSFSGICCEADNASVYILIALAYLLLCVIFVRKDKDYVYTTLDKISILFNFIVGLIVMPFISIVCLFIDINGTADNFTAFFAYTIPPIEYTCLALSTVFRRKGYSKTGIVIQFAGVVMFALLLLSETISSFFI